MNPPVANSAAGVPVPGAPAPGTPALATPAPATPAPATPAPSVPAPGAPSFGPGGLSRLGWVVLGLLALATWALAHPYLGLFHDAGLYTLQALARLHPDLSADVFLKYGSQDRFTVFSPIYAQLCRLWGVEPAAAALTLTFQIGLLLAAASLARLGMSASMTLLAVGALIALPGPYGAYRTFTCIEPFLTPRMAAELVVLASLAAALRGIKPLAVALSLAALLIHPIMAMAGVCALYCLYVGESKPIVALALAIVGLKALALAAYAMPLGPWGRFDAEWLALVQDRSPYLFLEYWQLEDWSRAAVSVATLVVGLGVLRNARACTLARMTVLTHLGGLALTLIACDWLHLVLFTQLQPWRWSWLGTVVAALLLPEILRTLWGGSDTPGERAGHAERSDAVPSPPEIPHSLRGGADTPGERPGHAARSVALLLLSAWIFASNAYALVAAIAALTALVGLHRLKATEARWVFYGSIALAAIAIVWRLASNLEFTEAYYLDPAIPLWLRRAMSFTRDGSVPLALMWLAWWLARWQRLPREPAMPLARAALAVPKSDFSTFPAPSAPASATSALPVAAADNSAPSVAPPTPRATWNLPAVAGTPASLAVLAVLAGASCVAVAPQTWHAWTRREFTAAQAARFADWRRVIPPDADVFWPEAPLGVWILLDRPSYLSVIQTSGMVFSRAGARELARRATALSTAINPGAFMSWSTTGTGMNLTAQQLRTACGTGAFDFLVTGADLGAGLAADEVAQAPSGWGPPSHELRLYRCKNRAAALQRFRGNATEGGRYGPRL